MVVEIPTSGDKAKNQCPQENADEQTYDKSDHWSLLKIQIQIVEVF